jgi:rieske iron-sulfur protein
LSDNQDNNEKKEDNPSTQNSQDASSSNQGSSQNQQQQQQKPAVKRPQIGTPINRPQVGTPVGKPAAQTPAAAPPPPTQPAQQAQPSAQAPAPANRPRIGTPIGTPVGKPAATAPSQSGQPAASTGGAQRPTVGTPVGTRPTVGTPVGAKPAVGTPVGAKPVGAPAAPAVGRPAISSPTAGRPAAPTKPPPSREEISRRNFIRGLAILGGAVAVLQFGALGPYLQGTVAGSNPGSQTIIDAITGATITTSSFSTATQWLTFVYPRTGQVNIDSDTFRQCVIIKLPKGFTAPANLSASDSTGTYCAFSRVCVHLWCLWSYVPTDMRMECPCHGSQYVPGTGIYPNLPIADNKPPGLAVEGPASLQVTPNNQLPMITIKINSDGSFTASGIVGQVGCGQLC